MATAVFLRCWQLGNIPGINGDEAWYGVQALRALNGQAISWTTPTGNPINPFFFVPLVALHTFLPPSVLTLRLVPLVSGLAALGVNFWLCRRTFDERTAVVSTLLLALLPINIAYSRFAWDASQSLLATTLVVYLPLLAIERRRSRGWLVAAAIFATVAAIVVHPTNVFAAAFLVVPVVYARRNAIGRALRFTTIPAKSWVLAGLVIGLSLVAGLAWHHLPKMGTYLHGPGELGQFAGSYLQLFSGTTVFRFISGAGTSTAVSGWFEYTTVAGEVGFALLAIVALCGEVRRLSGATSSTETCLVASWLTMLGAFFVVAGPQAIAPHFERYGVCLIAPAALVLARGLAWWLEPRHAGSAKFAVVLAVAAWLWPLSFGVNYYQCFMGTGGLSHHTFRTAAVEPKLAGVLTVLNHRRPAEPIVIVCHDWWSYWPVAYLAFDAPQSRVLTWKSWRRNHRQRNAGRSEDVWFIEFSGSLGEWDALQLANNDDFSVFRATIDDYGTRPLITVLGPLKNFSQNY